MILAIFQYNMLKKILGRNLEENELLDVELSNKRIEFESELARKKMELENELAKLKYELSTKESDIDKELAKTKLELADKESALNKELELIESKKSSFEGGLAAIEEGHKKTVQYLEDAIRALKLDLKELEHDVSTGQYVYSEYDGVTSEECKNQISMLKQKEIDLLKEDFTTCDNGFSKQENNKNLRKILRIFNAECDNAFLNLTVKSVNTQRNRIAKSFETLNKLFEAEKLQMPNELLEIKLEMLNLTFTYEQKKEEEAEQRRYIREQLAEEEKVRREIEREKAKLEKEESQFRNEVSKLMEYMNVAESDVDKRLYADKINELDEKLKELGKDKANVLERETNTRAGFVYVISNIGSFGENVYKIGMTRRLEPMDRIKELSSASVPFVFDVHAMIFSQDAPALETILHKEFRQYEVNKINPRKEFFKLDLDKIEKVVKEHHNATVSFTHYAQAKEYRESVGTSDK